MEKILVVTVNWLGDALMTMPVFKALKEKFPDAYIGIMAHQRVCPLFEHNPYIDQVIPFDEKGQQRSWFRRLCFIRHLRKERYNTVFLIHRSFTKALICYLSGIPNRIGYRRLKTNFLLTKLIDSPPLPLHRQDYYCYLLILLALDTLFGR